MNCPICKKPVKSEEAERPATFPFCSERCRLTDLGRWLDGKYFIPVSEPDSSESSAIDDSAD